jgi:hypothetical protein
MLFHLRLKMRAVRKIRLRYSSYGTRSPLKNMRARAGSYHILFFPARRARALKIRQINSAILKVPDTALIR